ncbi:hypothetical protein L0F63_001358 [Massospora cicadina]|nr:hypothetical protein L0F63_001358 [Massospora cicadina]
MSGQDSCGKTASLGGQVKTKFRVDVSYQASEAGPSDSPAAVSEAGSSGVGTEEVQAIIARWREITLRRGWFDGYQPWGPRLDIRVNQLRHLGSCGEPSSTWKGSAVIGGVPIVFYVSEAHPESRDPFLLFYSNVTVMAGQPSFVQVSYKFRRRYSSTLVCTDRRARLWGRGGHVGTGMLYRGAFIGGRGLGVDPNCGFIYVFETVAHKGMVPGEVDAILTALYVGAGRPAAVGVPSLLRVALSNPTGAWVFEESGLELLLLWYPALTPKFQAALLSVDAARKGNIRNLTALGEAAHGQRANPELLIYSVELGTLISQDPNVFVQEIKGEVLNLLSPGMPRGGGYDFATRALEGLTPHLVRYRDLYASEAVPLLIAGIREGAWRTKVRGELMAHLATRSTAEAVVDCVGGLPFLLSRDNAEASVAVVSALASRLVQLPDAPDLLGGLAELLCTQLQSLVGCASSLSGLEAGVAVMHRALGRGSGPLALPKAASEQVSSLLIRLGNHGHHVALLRHSPETLLSYLSLVGRYAANDPSVAAHLEQLLAAGGWEVVAQSDGLPLLGARFPQGPYSSLLHRYWCSSGAPHPPIRRRLFEALLALGEDLLLNAFEEPKPREGPPPARPSSMLLRMRLPALHHDYELSPDSYPAPNPAQFEYLWGKYPLRYTGPVWRAEGYKRPSNLPTSDVVVKTVAAAPPSRNGSSLKWCGYTFETRHQLLILMTYRSHAPGEGAELTVRSGSAIPLACSWALKVSSVPSPSLEPYSSGLAIGEAGPLAIPYLICN